MPPALGPLAPNADHTVTAVERSTGTGSYYTHVDDNPASGQPDSDWLGIRAGAFVPTSLSGLVGWYDMSDTATITQSAGAVSQVDDKSGNANHITQGTAAAKPTTGTTTLNSLNVLAFDGGDYLLKSTTPALNASTIFAVAQFTNFTVNRIVVAGASGSAVILVGAQITTARLRVNRGTNINGTNAISAATPYLLTMTNAAGGGASSANGWINATQEITNANPGTANTTGFQIGASLGTPTMLGFIAEVVIYDNVKGTTDREACRDYLKAKWAVY